MPKSSGDTSGDTLLFWFSEGSFMPRKRKEVRGVWEQEPGSDIWWIRFRVDGVLKREKVPARNAHPHRSCALTRTNMEAKPR
jgi:hypothetical protein